MSNLPESKQDWFSLLLLPFKAYVIIAPIWVFYSTSDSYVVRVGLRESSSYVLVAYAICVPFFLLAALIQLSARQRRAAFTSIAFGLGTFVVLVILWLRITSGLVR